MATLTSDQLAQLAEDYQSLGEALLQFKLDNAATLDSMTFQDLGSRINLIIHNSNVLAAMATYSIASDISQQLTSIGQATKDITGALQTIKSVQNAIDIATAVVNVGTSLLSLNVNGVVSGVSDLVTAIQNA